MIDYDVHRRAWMAQIQADAANVRAHDAAEILALVHTDRTRLVKEVSITSSIASELLSALIVADPQVAGRVSESLLLRYGKYKGGPSGFSVGKAIEMCHDRAAASRAARAMRGASGAPGPRVALAA